MSTSDLDPVTAEKVREYTYRKTFRLTHDEYLDEPEETVIWMTRIGNIFDEIAEKESRV